MNVWFGALLLLLTAYLSVLADDPCPAQDGPNSTYIAHPLCDRFWQCSNGKRVLQLCPPGLNFNAKKSVCDWPTSAECKGKTCYKCWHKGKIPMPNTCKGYFNCNENDCKAYIEYCAKDEHFDAYHNKCVDKAEAACEKVLFSPNFMAPSMV